MNSNNKEYIQPHDRVVQNTYPQAFAMFWDISLGTGNPNKNKKGFGTCRFSGFYSR